MHILKIITDIIFVVAAPINIGLWLWNGCRLPRYVHGMALVAFLLGGWAGYEIYTLGSSLISILWVPFLCAGIVYTGFILHYADLPEDKIKKLRGSAE